MRPLDLVAIAVHGSFFVVRTAVAMALLRHDRRHFTRYWTATAITLTLSTAGFVLWPTMPPWMHAPTEVRRVIIDTGRAIRLVPLESRLGREDNDRPLPFDPNLLAAMPSVHVAAAVLVAHAGRDHRPVIRSLGSAYAVGMSASVVYLGEHDIVDVLGGWLVAGIGWRATHDGGCKQTQVAIS